MKILVIADFRLDSPHHLLNNPRMFSKGFLRNGHDVLNFSYRDMILRHALFNSKRLAAATGKKKTDRMLAELATHYNPDMVFIAAFKLLDEHTISSLKKILPNALFMCWYSDMFDGVDPKIAPIAKCCDWFLSSGAGDFLTKYKKLGIPHCAFMPNPCDKDIEFYRETPPQWQQEVIFTGKLRHGQSGQDPMRWELIHALKKQKNIHIYGGDSQASVKGDDYLNALRGAKIAISINAFNHVDKYHSDRLIHYLSCGAFTLARYVPKSELLFENKKHLCYFETIEQCAELIDEYLQNEPKRKTIAKAGMDHAHNEFECQILAKHIIDLAEKGTYLAPWCEII